MDQVKFVEDRLWKISSNMVCLSRPYHFILFKRCLPQILLGPLLNILPQMRLINAFMHKLTLLRWKMAKHTLKILWCEHKILRNVSSFFSIIQLLKPNQKNVLHLLGARWATLQRSIGPKIDFIKLVQN